MPQKVATWINRQKNPYQGKSSFQNMLFEQLTPNPVDASMSDLSKKKRSTVLVLFLLFSLGAAVEAHAVTISALAPQTISGQDYEFVFSDILVSDGSDGVFTIHARGDYHPANPTEFLSWDLDSMGIGSAAGPPIGGATIIQENSVNDVEWTQSFDILGADLLSLTSDGAISILLDLNLDSQLLGVDCCFSGMEFVQVSLGYDAAIPEPSPALLFAVGMGCIGGCGTLRTARRLDA